MRSSVLFFLPLLLLGTWLFPEVATTQTVDDGVRELAPADAEALEAWAEARLAELDGEARGTSVSLEIERLWALYFLSVDSKDREREALDHLEKLDPAPIQGSPEWRTLEALRGAVEVVRAKHSRWPPNKLKHLRRGLEILNALVASHPEAVEVRYLRLVSCYYLPFFLDQDELVQADLDVLIDRLPHDAGTLSPIVYRGVVLFVLKNGDLTELDRERLRGSLS